MYWMEKWVDGQMDEWTEGKKESRKKYSASSIGTYSEQANLFQVRQTMCSINKNVNTAWKMHLDIQCMFYIDFGLY